VARKTIIILVCDNCGNEVADGKGATMRVKFDDTQRGVKRADLCEPCAEALPGSIAARRRRRRKESSAEETQAV
jgi:hypothetical protein